MKPIYEENEETLEIAEQISCHIPPHLHKSMELVSVTEVHWKSESELNCIIWKKAILHLYFRN